MLLNNLYRFLFIQRRTETENNHFNKVIPRNGCYRSRDKTYHFPPHLSHNDGSPTSLSSSLLAGPCPCLLQRGEGSLSRRCWRCRRGRLRMARLWLTVSRSLGVKMVKDWMESSQIGVVDETGGEVTHHPDRPGDRHGRSRHRRILWCRDRCCQARRGRVRWEGWTFSRVSGRLGGNVSGLMISGSSRVR